MNNEFIPLLLLFFLSLIINFILLKQRNKNLKQLQKYEKNIQECLERLDTQKEYTNIYLKEIIKLKQKDN